MAVLQMVDLKIVRTLWRVQSKYCKSCNVNEELIFPNLPNSFKAFKLKTVSQTIFVGMVWQMFGQFSGNKSIGK